MPGALKRLWSEDGSAGAGILWFSLCAVFGGLAIDITNAYRAHQLLVQTADTAAHAGVVALAGGANDADVRAAVLAEVERNMPFRDHGDLIRNPEYAIQLATFDPEANTLSAPGSGVNKANTVIVNLTRDHTAGNVVSMIILPITDAVDRNGEVDYTGWEMQHTSASALAETMQCRSGNFFYARGELQLTSQNTFGARYCLHSQSEVWMPQQNTFQEAAGISMPDLAACGSKCDDTANPGAGEAAFETNLLSESLDDVIERVRSDFLASGDESQSFFSGKSLDADLSLLDGLGIDTTNLTLGSVVDVTKNEFESLPRIPNGLTYHVDCPNGGQPLDVNVPSGSAMLSDVAVMTDCALRFNGTLEIQSSVFLTTKNSANANVTADSGAHFGTFEVACKPEQHSYLYTVGKMQVPADFVASNATIVAKGEIKFAASSASGTLPHVGVTMITDGDMHVSAGHHLSSCAKPPDGKTPRLRLIRQIEMMGTQTVTSTGI